jgi:hypothetical protein
MLGIVFMPLTENTKLAASDAFQHPHPFRGMTIPSGSGDELSTRDSFVAPCHQDLMV